MKILAALDLADTTPTVLKEARDWARLGAKLWLLHVVAPDPDSMAKADPGRVAAILRPLGLQNSKARRMIRFSEEWQSGAPVGKVHGIGQYGRVSYAIFVENRLSTKPADHVLSATRQSTASAISARPRNSASWSMISPRCWPLCPLMCRIFHPCGKGASRHAEPYQTAGRGPAR